jgi:hypothetical protein
MCLVKQVFYCRSEYTEKVEQNSVEIFPESHVPHRNILRQLTDMFRETGCVDVSPRSGRLTSFIKGPNTRHF